MKHQFNQVPATLRIRYQIWSTSAAGDFPAGMGWFDDIEKAREVMERRRKQHEDEIAASKPGKKL